MSNLSKYIVTGFVTLVVLFLAWYFKNIVAYILVAAVLAIIGKPLVDLLTGIHIGKITLPRWVASLITLILIWLVIVGVFWLFVPIIFEKISELASLDITTVLDSFWEPIQSLQEFLEKTFSIETSDFSIADAIVSQVSSIFNIDAVNNVLSSVITTVANVLISAFSITFITFFFLKESNLFPEMIITVFPKKYEENITRALDSVTNLLVRYFTGIVAENSIMTVIVSGGLLIWGFSWQDALTIGAFVGLFNVIPYIGPIIGIVLGLFIGLIGGLGDVSSLGIALRIAGTILFAQLIDNVILQPVLYSNRAKAHPLEIFLVILIAGSIAGIWGMLLAIPAYNVLRVFAKEFFYNFRVVRKLTEKI